MKRKEMIATAVKTAIAHGLSKVAALVKTIAKATTETGTGTEDDEDGDGTARGEHEHSFKPDPLAPERPRQPERVPDPEKKPPEEVPQLWEPGVMDPIYCEYDRTAIRADGRDRHIKEELTSLNINGNIYGDPSLNHDEVERKFYAESYTKTIEARNARYRAHGVADRCQTVEDLRHNPKTCPQETILQIGDSDIMAEMIQRAGGDERRAKEIMTEITEDAVSRYFRYLGENYGGPCARADGIHTRRRGKRTLSRANGL